MRRQLLPLLSIVFCSMVAGSPAVAGTDDADNDGLPDSWEASLGYSTKRATLIVVPVLRPGMTRDQVRPTLDKVTAFYKKVPNKNLDGSTGIDVVIRWGITLPAADATTDYKALRTRGLPSSLVGKAHGVLIAPGTSGGGQTTGNDWSVSENEWHTIAHELGHQLGLGHTPPGSPASPLYASIMNYDYNYTFNGSSDAVQFSTGKFRQARLNEANLAEVLPFAMGNLQFLAATPYKYALKTYGTNATLIDWNRNGKFGETGVRADINGGYALTPRDRVDSTKVAGGFALATFKSRLVSVFADNTAKTTLAYKAPNLSTTSTGWIGYQVHGSNGPCTPSHLPNSYNAVGDPHAIEAFGKLFVSFPIAAGYAVAAYTAQGAVPADGCVVLAGAGAATELHAPGIRPVLVRGKNPESIAAFYWNPTSRRVLWRKVNASAATNTVTLGGYADLSKSDGSLLMSESQIAGTYNTKTGRFVLIITERGTSFKGWMKMVELVKSGDKLVVHSIRPLVSSVESAGNSTLSQPTILFDDRPTAGATGQYTIYARGERTDPKVTAPTSVVKLIPGSGGAPDYWTKQKMMNEWAITVSPPSAVLFKDDVAWGFRVWDDKNVAFHNMLQIFTRASGETDSSLTDHDDVTFIATQGLKKVRR